MSEPKPIGRDDFAEALKPNDITINVTDAWSDDDVQEAMKALRELLPDGLDWYRCKPCPFCGETAVIVLPIEGVKKYAAGAHPQDAFPNESVGKREMVHTGIHPECWDKFLPEPED